MKMFLNRIVCVGAACLFTFSLSAQAQTTEERIAERDALKAAQIDSVIVVFKEEAVSQKDWRGKSAADKASFKSIEAPRKLIKSKPKKAKKNAKAETRAASRLRRMHTAKIVEGSTLNETLKELSASPLVEYAEPNYPRELFAMPNDTHFAIEQWSLNNTGQVHHTSSIPDGTVDGAPGADINWLPAWEAGLPTNEIIIAVIDTGVDYTHPELVNQMWVNTDEIPGNGIDDDSNGYIDDIYGIDPVNADTDPMDDHGHGTHCAGTIAAEADNNYGIAGICPSAKIMSCKIFDENGSGDVIAAAIESVEYAVNNGAMVLNNSWGGAGYSESMQAAVDYATENGVVFMAAAGNDGVFVRKYPAAYNGVTCVAASDSFDRHASFSTYGPWVDVTAPGVYILSLLSSVNEIPADYGRFDSDLLILSGTSMATPTASGAMGLLMSKYPGYEPWIYEKVMEATCSTNFYDIPENTNYVGYFGAGRIDVNKMLTHDEASAFLSAQINLDRQSTSYYISPGQSTNFTINVGTWADEVTNLSIIATALTSNSSFNVTSHYVGTISAQTTTNIADNTFVVTVPTNAPWGSVEEVRFDLKSGTTLLDSQSVLFQVFPALLGNFLIDDLDGDGRNEIIGTLGGLNGDNLLMVFDETGTKIKWFKDFGGRNYDISGYTVGDLDNDGTKEVICSVMYFPLLHEGDLLHVFEYDGTERTNDHWPRDIYNLIGDALVTANQPALADMDNDGDLDVVCTGASSYNELAIVIYDELGNEMDRWVGPPTFPEPNKSDSMNYFSWMRAPALGDVNGDGTNNIVTVEFDDLTDESYVTLRNHHAEVMDSVLIDPDVSELMVVESQPTLADLDQDGKLEILFRTRREGQSHYLHAYDDDLSPMDGFPVSIGVGFQVPSTPSIADVDGDGDLEIFIRRLTGKTLMGLDHFGNPLPNFPLVDTNFTEGSYNSTLIGNVDADPEPEMIYGGNYQVDTTDESRPYSFQIFARDFDGLLIPGYPKTVTGTDGPSSPATFSLTLDAMGGSEFGTNLYIMTAKGGVMHLLDTGVPYVEEQEQWPLSSADAQHTYRYKAVPSKLIGNLHSYTRYGFNTLNATFDSHVMASNSSPIYYRWDFDNNGSVDAEGYDLIQTNYTYSSPGLYSVKLTFSNDAGEVYTALRSNYIQVFNDLEAGFTATPTGTLTAPVEVSFTDTTPGLPQTWSWDFDDGNTSTEQNPKHIYTNTGTFSVSLTVSNDFGVGGTDVSTFTRTNLITISSVEDVTVHYVSPNGGHVYPFKSWAHAATNLQAAVGASSDGHEIIITNGTYYPQVPEGEIISVTNAINIHSVNGPDVTFFDGEGSYNSIQLDHTNAILDGLTIQHFVGDLFAFELRNGLARNLIIRENSTISEFFFGFSVVKVGSPFGGKRAELVNCRVEDNRTPNVPLEMHTGGVVSNCVVRRNEATGQGNTGSCGATINAEASIYNTLFADNRGGASVVRFIGAGQLYNCTVVNNDISGSDHGALYFKYGFNANQRFIYNSIFANNIGGDIYFSTGVSESTNQAWIYNSRFSTAVPFLNPEHVIGCITDDPQFVNVTAGNYHLLPSSPCKDTGENLWVYTNVVKEVLVDFGWATNDTFGVWNNMTSTNAGATLSNMKMRADGWSGIDLTMLTNAYFIAQGLYLPEYWYPAEAQNDTFMYDLQGDDGWHDIFKLSGMNTNSPYDIGIFVTYDGFYEAAYYGTQDEIPILVKGTYQTGAAGKIPYAEFTEFWPTNSEVVVSAGAYRYAPLSILHVKEYDPDDKVSELDGTDLDGHPRLYNGLIDMGAYEYQSNTPPFIAAFTITPESGSAPLFTTLSIDVSDPDGSITNCVWNLGDGTQTNGTLLTNLTHTYTSPGEYVVSVTVYDNKGFSDNRHQAVFVSNIPSAPTGFAGVNISPTQNDLGWQDTSALETGLVMQRRVTEAWVNKTLDDGDEGVSYTKDAIAEEDWETKIDSTAYNGSCQYITRHGSDPGGGAYRAHYDPDFTETGLYEIFEWHPVDPDATVAAVHEVYTQDGRVNIFVDQSRNGQQWNSLGIYTLDIDSKVVIDARQLPGDVFADALRFERVDIFDPLTNLAQNATNSTDLTVLDDRNYTYRLAAINGYGSSAWVQTSVYVAPTNQFPIATIVSVTPTSGVPFLNVDAVASGTDADGTVTNYIWNFGDGYAGSVQSGANLTNAHYAYRYTGLYTVTLTVQDNLGYFSTNTATQQVLVYNAIPNAPKNLAAQSVGSSHVAVSWTEWAYNEERVVLQRQVDGGTFSSLATLGVNANSYNDTNVMFGTIYGYRARTENAAGTSEWSNVGSTLFGAGADYDLPFSETFETSPTHMAGTLGDVDGQHGWTVGTGGGANVQNATAHDSPQALVVSNTTVSHNFIGSASNIWISYWAQPGRGPEPSAIPADASAVFYVNDSDQLVAYSNTTAITPGTTVSNGWNKFAVHCDYVSKVWNLELNDTLVVSNFPFYGALDGFIELKFIAHSENLLYADEINVTDSLTDADGDGLPDWWEENYWGDTSPHPDNLASNGVNTVMQAYIAGIDPTDPDAFFELSNLRNIVQWNSASGRVYSIYWTSNLLSGFNEVLHSNVTGGVFTDSLHGAEQKGFYKIEVELE